MTGHDRLRVLFPDHLGLVRGKHLPWRLADRGSGFCTGTTVRFDTARSVPHAC